jgi:hypothetical protein
MRFISTTVAAAAVPLLVAACSSASPTGSAEPTRAATSSAAAAPNAGLLKGTQLKALLAPVSWFPSGFTADPTGSVNTGDTYQEPSPTTGPPDCTKLDGTAWVDLSGVGSVSFAQNDFIDQSTSEQYAQEIDVYQGTSAQEAMAGLRKLAGTCPTFHDAQTSSTVTVKLMNGPALGDDALTFTLDSPMWGGGLTLEAVRVGTAVATVLYSAASGSATTQATRLAAAVTANLKNKA